MRWGGSDPLLLSVIFSRHCGRCGGRRAEQPAPKIVSAKHLGDADDAVQNDRFERSATGFREPEDIARAIKNVDQMRAFIREPTRLYESCAGTQTGPVEDKKPLGGLRMNAKKVIAKATIAGTLAVSALGLGAGVANASTPARNNMPSVQWHQDDGGWCWWWCFRPWRGHGDD